MELRANSHTCSVCQLASRAIACAVAGLTLVLTCLPALAATLHVKSHGIALSIPEPSGIPLASTRLTNGIQAVGVIPGEQLLALFVNEDNSAHSPPSIKMMQVVTSINGRHVPISISEFAKQIEKSKKVITAYKQDDVQRCRLLVDKRREFGFICNPGENDRFVTASVSILVKGLVISVSTAGIPGTKSKDLGPAAKEALKEAKAIIKANM